MNPISWSSFYSKVLDGDDAFTGNDESPKETKEASESKPKNHWKNSGSKAKLSYQEQKEYKKLEKEIAQLETEKETLENKFATENWDGEEIDKQSIKLQEIADNIETKTERWFELSAKMEEA